MPPVIPDRRGEAIQELEGRPACLIRFLPGVSVSAPTAGQAHAAGAALASMHRAVADFPRERPNTMGRASWAALHARCGASLDRIAPGLHDDLAEALRVAEAGWPDEALDRCVIHADLFPDNVLMLDDRVAGLIDFYFACTDIRLLDLAITHVAWSFDASGRQHDRAVGDALLAGYETLFPLSAEERAAWRTLATGACIRFTLSRAWDWLNTPADALVTRKDPLAFWRRLAAYDPVLAARLRSCR